MRTRASRAAESGALTLAALAGRSPDVIATALKRNRQLDALLDSAILQPYIKAAISNALLVIQKHWSARQAVFLMSEGHT